MIRFLFRVFSFATFTVEFYRMIGTVWDCSCLICAVFYHIYCRIDRISSSLSAAQTFFDLFDRTPTIDNASTEGQKLVSKLMTILLSQVNHVSYRLIFVEKYNLIKSSLFIQLDQHGLFLKHFNSRSNQVRATHRLWSLTCNYFELISKVNVWLLLVCSENLLFYCSYYHMIQMM